MINGALSRVQTVAALDPLTIVSIPPDDLSHTVSKTKTDSSNRGDNANIPGAVIRGYIIVKPNYPVCIDDLGFLWFENEAVVAGSASWGVGGNAAEAIVKESK